MYKRQGYITIVSHKEQLITDTIEVDLFNGNSTIIENTRINWNVSGRGSCREGSYELIHAKTALKIKSLKILNPMVEICLDNTPASGMDLFNTYLPIFKDKLPYKAKVVIVYYKPVIKEMYFKQEFNMSLNSYPIKITTDHNPDMGISKLIIKNSKDKPKISVEFPLSKTLSKPGFNAKSSSVIIKDNKGKTINLGNVNFKDNYYIFNDKYIIEIENLPPKGTGYLLAEIKLALDEYTEEIEVFTIDFEPNKESNIEIDNYNIALVEMNNNYTLFPKGTDFCCGIPGREVVRIRVFDNIGKEVKGNHTEHSIIIPDNSKPYKIQIETKGKKTKYETISKKISLGSVINISNSVKK